MHFYLLFGQILNMNEKSITTLQGAFSSLSINFT